MIHKYLKTDTKNFQIFVLILAGSITTSLILSHMKLCYNIKIMNSFS